MPSFHDIIGQEQIREYLATAVATGQVSHSYILSGERGAGKEFIARVFAMALQCGESVAERPCQRCKACQLALRDSHPDIKFIACDPKHPNTIRVDDIRDQLIGDIVIIPYRGPYKIYIIRDAELMSIAAQNALLKTLEEPPAYAVIIMLTTNALALTPTVQSRSLVLNMTAVPDAALRTYLMEEVGLPRERADICVAFARGNIGKARTLALSEEFALLMDEAISLLKNIEKLDTGELIQAVGRIRKLKFDIGDYLDILAIWYRDILLYKATRDEGLIICRGEREHIRRMAKVCSYEGLEAVLEALERAKARLEANVNFELTMELLLLTIKDCKL